MPDQPLPPHAYVAGKFPHPTRDPRGHSFGKPTLQVETVDPNRWRDCAPYQRGIDLFNHGYYWEAHEAWESVWHAAGRHGSTADFLKGLIALAAAGYKALEGQPEGVRRHAARARKLFRGLRLGKVGQASCLSPPPPSAGDRHPACPTFPERFMGLSLADLVSYSAALEQRPGRPAFTLDVK